jgi:4-hydroxy-tetrahydrodipicolinate reductase
MTKVIIAGAAGRMGRRIGYMVNEQPELQVAAGFERPDSPDVGKDMGELGGYGSNGVMVADDLAAVIDQGDVIIDFTFHEATMKIARQAAQKNRAMVI